MKGLKSVIVSIFIVALLAMVLGLCVVQLRNCSGDTPDDPVIDDPVVIEIILDETEIVF